MMNTRARISPEKDEAGFSRRRKDAGILDEVSRAPPG
jgi:hypothetical protein